MQASTLPTRLVFNTELQKPHMNTRFVIVGVALGVVIAIAVIVGSPAIGGFDMMR